MTPGELAEALKQVPPKHLQLITLAWELVGEDGLVDIHKARYRMEDIVVAKGEATGYAQATHQMLEALKQCLKSDP